MVYRLQVNHLFLREAIFSDIGTFFTGWVELVHLMWMFFLGGKGFQIVPRDLGNIVRDNFPDDESGG